MKESRKSNWEEFWDQKKDIEEVYSNSDRVSRNLMAVVDLRDKKILEVGAGTGRDSFPMLEQGGRIFQLDYSINSLTIMKRIADEQSLDVSIVGGDTFQLPFPDETFDVVFHQGLLEHFRPVQALSLLRENVRVLKRGGLLLVDVPQRYHIYTLVKHFLIAINKWFAGWEREFSAPELRKEMERCGLTIVRTYGEWMYPSFFYRASREVLRKAGIRLPLYPKIPLLHSLRRKVRESLRDRIVAINTALSVGVIGQKS
jgi:ubiquinone/menaquinone biosynthesis C-methylase UbiE